MSHHSTETQHPADASAETESASKQRPCLSESFVRQGVRLDQLQQNEAYAEGARLAGATTKLGIGNTELTIHRLRPPDVEEAFHLQVPEGVVLITHDPKQDAYQPITPILIPSGESMVIGRDTVAGLTRDPEVSRKHVEVGCTDTGEAWIKHVGQTNGTRLS